MFNRTIFTWRDKVRLRGDHNLSNMLGAAAIAGSIGADIESMTRVAESFEGVRHRLEIVADVGGVTWVNDSIATSPERAVAGLRSYDPAKQSIFLLAGGKDKKLPWDLFAEETLARVTFLIGFGDAGSMIVEKVRTMGEERLARLPGMAVVNRLDEAVELAARSANANTVVLLSPGGTSYDAYRDFEARGEHFRELVAQFAPLAARSEAQSNAGMGSVL
jgi:UDP-N-acetylmuramoylalanine--D-glutamate ligase